jgi:hypothetical protein
VTSPRAARTIKGASASATAAGGACARTTTAVRKPAALAVADALHFTGLPAALLRA